MTELFPADRTVIITGAASPRGIGRATAERLAGEGWNIGIIDLDLAACQQFAADLEAAHGIRAFGINADVSDEKSAHAAVDAIAENLPQVVGLANIAGVSSPVPYLEVDASEWNRVLNINLSGAHYVSQQAARLMVKNELGRIVNISSVSAQRGGGTFGKTPYSVAKAGIIGLTRSLARELGPFDVTVNAIAPGPIDTDIMGGRLTDERKAELIKDQLIGRVGSVHDVAAAISFLLREDSGFITGQTLSVNGGLHMS